MLKLLRIALALSMLLSTALFILWSWRWPLIGDAALIHYIGFLIERGMPPYRVLGDMNMPGSFLLEMAAMKVYGGGDLAWRLFDFTLLAAAAAAFRVLTRRAGWFAAVFAACLFALVHGRDGITQGGQRDLSMAVLLIAATACLFTAVRHRTAWALAGFGLLAGAAFTIKPTAVPLATVQLAIALWIMRQQESGWRTKVLPALGAMLVAPAGALIFLLRQHAFSAFLHGLQTVVPYYASLGHKPLGFLLLHSISPLLALVLLWLAVLAMSRPAFEWERLMLASGAFFGLLSYIVQARAMPYYRYPLLAYLIPLIALDLTQAASGLTARPRDRLRTGLAIAGLCAGGFVLAPQSAFLVHQYRWWQTDFISSLTSNLQALGGPALSGRVQCIDWISGCGTTLYRMRLQQSSGVLSDFLLFGPRSYRSCRKPAAP